MNKKAQTEVIGLAFVVIIAIFGLIIYVSLTSSAESTDSLRQKQLASSMITTMIQVDLGDIKYQDLVANCVARNQGCDNLTSYSESMLLELNKLNQPYKFEILDSNDQVEIGPIKNDEDSCTRNVKAVATQPVSLYGSSDKAMIILSLCD